MPTIVKAGDRVLLPGWGGNSIKVGEDVRSTICCYLYSSYSRTLIALLAQEYFLFKDSEILAKIQE